jgi:predicted transcriptional regulator
MGKSLVEMAAAIVESQSSSKGMSTEEITFSLQSTFKALIDLQADEVRSAAEGVVSEGNGGALAISPEKSIQKNKIICIECGQEFRMLSPKHLKSHGLTGREYRAKHGFSLRQPLCAKSLSERRKKAGKARGLPENLKKAIAMRKKSGKGRPRKKK